MLVDGVAGEKNLQAPMVRTTLNSGVNESINVNNKKEAKKEKEREKEKKGGGGGGGGTRRRTTIG